MNVLYLINFAGKAGTEKYVENLVRILGQEKIKPFFAYCVEGELSEKMKQSGIPCIQLEMSWRSALSAARKLAEFCRSNEIDVIHAQYPRENIIALLSKRHYAKPRVVMTNHLTLRLSGASGFIWRCLNKHFTPKNQKIIAVCNEGREIMIQNGVKPERIEVIFNGIEPSGGPLRNEAKRQELELRADCFTIAILARFAPEKGLSFLLDALAELKRKTDKPFCCLICGDGALYDEIRVKISDLALEDNCRLLGFRKDTKEILLASDCYVCSSSNNEAMSFAILEAMDCGLPLVVTDVGGNRDLAETGLSCGFVVPFGEVETFADKLLTLLKDSDLRSELSINAIKKIERVFNLNKLAFDVYNSYC